MAHEARAEQAYQLAKAYDAILRERGVTRPWTLVPPTDADMAECYRRAGLKP